MLQDFAPFRPALSGIFAARFYEQSLMLCAQALSFEEREQFILGEVAWAAQATVNPKQRRIYRAAWLLLRDLLRVGWEIRWNNTLEVAPPIQDESVQDPASIGRIKDRVRQAMLAGRLEKIREGRDFVERVEKANPKAGVVPISNLIANGQDLAADMRRIAGLPDEQTKLDELRRAIRPYLQLVNENERCSETGHRLSDIWRYFRFTWSTPAENTPGRTLLYLVRDRARPYHPVIGIASLENAPLKVLARDDYLGWSLEAFKAEVLESRTEEKVRASFARLLRYITSALDEVNLEGLCTLEECEHPNEDLLIRLAGIVARTTTDREAALSAWRRSKTDGDDDDEFERSELGNISTAAEDLLFKRKRADRVGRLLSARRAIQDLLESSSFADKWERWINTESGQTAIWAALVSLKNLHVGTSILELNVCGAIPPYNELLTGKLVALLMASPQIIQDYRNRYGGRPSDIASRMKGEPVVRPAELAYIGTTSLYRHGASQYQRLKLPAGLMQDQAPELHWKQLGETSGYGTWHISRLTLQAFEEAADYQNANHVFGEGASVKLRSIRQALDELFEQGQRGLTDDMTKHAMKRLVYGTYLAVNGRAYLRGEEDIPHYRFPNDIDPAEGTEKIVEYWRKRWLLSRLKFTEAFDRLEHFDPTSLVVGRLLEQSSEKPFTPIKEEIHQVQILTPGTGNQWLDYVRGLYRGQSAYADSIDAVLLDQIHVQTRLDSAILDAVRAGKHCVLTGNAGDGKSHLLRVLETQLAALPNRPVIELDASAVPDVELHANWSQAHVEGRPYCVAINEAVLFGLADQFPAFAPLSEARDQVENAVLYDPEVSKNTSVIVFDLSRRNVLSRDVVNGVIENLTNPSRLTRCSMCPVEGCDLMRNQTLLRSERVKERLQQQLDRISRRGYHATLRELQAFLSYLLFGGRNCIELIAQSGNHDLGFPNLPFLGRGKLFDQFRASLDPASVTHPIWDDRLVGGQTDATGWLPDWTSETRSLEAANDKAFAVRKRAFYYIHENGSAAFALSDDDETAFSELLTKQERDALRTIIRKINRFFSGEDSPEELQVWQSHRYNQAPRRVLYSALSRKRQEFEIARPRLRSSMSQGFDLAEDHVLLRLHNEHSVRLRIDFPLFQLLAQSERGVPTPFLESPVVRRLWQFMEQLSTSPTKDGRSEVTVRILDPVAGEAMTVEVDSDEGQYLSMSRRSFFNGHRS